MNHWERLTILRRLRYTKIHGGGLVLTPWDNEKWIPGQDQEETITGTAAEDWTRAFNEHIVGTDYTPGALSPELLKEFRDQIFAVVSVDYLDEAEAKEEEYEKKRAAAIEHYKTQRHMNEEVAEQAAEEALAMWRRDDADDEKRKRQERVKHKRQPKGTNAEDARRAREEYVRKLEAKTPEAPEVLHELAEAEREEFAGEYDHPHSTEQEIRAAILRAEEGREAGENSEA